MCLDGQYTLVLKYLQMSDRGAELALLETSLYFVNGEGHGLLQASRSPVIAEATSRHCGGHLTA